MKLVLLSVGQIKEPWFNQVTEIYEKKIGHMVDLEVVRLKSKAHGRDSFEHKRDEESQVLLKAIDNRDYVILFDERGKNFDSIKFSENLVRAFETGKRVVMIVGGAFGVNDEVKARANQTLSLSSLVFNHLVAQVVVAEQVYRALTIWKGLPYHNE